MLLNILHHKILNWYEKICRGFRNFITNIFQLKTPNFSPEYTIIAGQGILILTEVLNNVVHTQTLFSIITFWIQFESGCSNSSLDVFYAFFHWTRVDLNKPKMLIIQFHTLSLWKNASHTNFIHFCKMSLIEFQRYFIVVLVSKLVSLH